MELFRLLGIEPGVTAVIGSGGKTSLLACLAREVSGTVILTTTTHIHPFAGVPLLTGADENELRRALAQNRVVCLGTPVENDKLTAPAVPIARLAALADFVLVEADGSRGLPIKAHAPHEPVIPPEARQTICVVGASGFGQPIAQAVHRPERFCALTDANPENVVSPALAARALLAEGLADTVFLNQMDACAVPVEPFAAPLRRAGVPVFGGSLQNGVWDAL